MDTAELLRHTNAMRRDLGDVVAGLDAGQLATPSLCAGWDVLTCAAHVGWAATASLPSFLVATLRFGGPDRATTGLARRRAARGRDNIAEALRAGGDFAPPVVGAYGPLCDLLVHGVDIRQPLGLPWEPDPVATAEGLRFLTAGRAVGFVRRGRLDGLRIEATDVDVASGAGELLRGRAIDLAAAVCGRRPALDALTGPGVAVLRGRLQSG